MRKLKISEELLIRLLREQHPDGAKALYDMYSAALFGVISRILIDVALSEDVLQDTFVKIWQSISQYENGKGRLFTWMVNIARNQAIDRVRSKSYRNGQRTQDLEGCEQIPLAGNEAYDRADRFFVRQGMERLRAKELEVVDLIYYRGYTHLEVAETLGIPLGTVKTRLTMAVNRLRDYYLDAGLALAS